MELKMDRKDFLKQLWKRLFIPTIILILIYSSIKFLFAAIRDNGTVRLSTITFLSLTIIYFSIYFLGKLLDKLLIEKIASRLSDKAKFRLRIIGKIIDYFAVLLLGVVLYKFWKEDVFLALILTSILIVDRIKAIVKEIKTAP